MNNCQVFTPAYIVKKMLDMINYQGESIKTKTIFEPSFGDGAFLVEIVERVMQYANDNQLSAYETCAILDNIYGVELDPKYYHSTIQRLNRIISNYSISYAWNNLICCDTLQYIAPTQFDLCVGNPPYQRIQHLNKETRKHIAENYQFCGGNTDLYVVFFECCLNMMKDNGTLCFITPNSYFKNTSQSNFREYLAKNNLVRELIDYSNVNVFGSISTYTAIALLNHRNAKTQYVKMKNEKEVAYKTEVDLKQFAKNAWCFTSPSDMKFLDELSKMPVKLKDLCEVQHGIATNADKIYVVNKTDVGNFEQNILRSAVKASTLNDENKIIFPYQWDENMQKYVVIDEKTMKEQYPRTYQYFSKNRDVLDKRDMEKNRTVWYQYARSQGIQNSNHKKFALMHVLSDKDKICKLKELDKTALVYSGVYIVVKDEKNYDKVKEILLSQEFHRYLLLVGKDMAGGYKNVSAKMIKEYRCLIKPPATHYL